MVAEDEDALICDFAQYYNIYDYTEMRPSKAAILAWGLPDDSRIKRKISKEPVSTNTQLLAAAVDNLRFLCWTKTKDAEKGRNMPKSILDMLMGNSDDKPKGKEKLTGYKTIDEYQKARAQLVNKVRSKK